ncbi:MAG: hypothetical protein DRO06_04905 [Thermoproteota archaeon]|nr:MAG: hypothetical protein DRO06_04905 [Candidatus Korarchaeota archaeon]
MSWAGLPGRDCGLCGAPSCAAALRMTSAGLMDPSSCPFADRVPTVRPWIAKPAPPSVITPCPSDRRLAEASLSLVFGEARFSPVDPLIAREMLEAWGVDSKVTLRGQLVIGEGPQLRIHLFGSGRLVVRSRLGREGTVELAVRIGRILSPAVVCQGEGLSEAESAAGWGDAPEIPCSPGLGQYVGLFRVGSTAGDLLRGDSDLADAVQSLRSGSTSEALAEAVSRLERGDPSGLWLAGLAVEVERCLRADPEREHFDLVAEALSGADVAAEAEERAEEARSIRDPEEAARALRPALAALAIVRSFSRRL